MKAILIALGLFALSASFSSCEKKERYCECNTTVNGSTTTSETDMGKISASDAADQCGSIQNAKNAVSANSTTCSVSE